MPAAERERVLPALGVRCVAEIVVRELVEHDDVGLLAQRRLVVEILEDAVADRLRGAAESAAGRRGDAFEVGTPLRFDPADGDALAVGGEPPRVFESRRVLPAPGALAT